MSVNFDTTKLYKIIFISKLSVYAKTATGNHKRVSTGMIVLAVIFLLRFLL